MHHCFNKDVFTGLLGLFPVNKAINQSLSLSKAVSKKLTNASNLALVLLVISNEFMSCENCFIS